MTADGKTVYSTWWREEQIGIFDLPKRTYRRVHPNEIGAPAGFRPCAMSNSGNLLGVTEKAAIAINVEKQTSATLYTAPTRSSLWDLAYNPADGGVAIALSWEIWPNASEYDNALVYVPAETEKAGEVFCRRIDKIYGMDFDERGNFYFGDFADLWCGRIEAQTPPERPYLLTAERHAPLATSETESSTGHGIGPRVVLVAGNSLYIGMAGRHWNWGSVIRLAHREEASPDTGELSRGMDIKRYAKRSQRYLASLQIITDADKYELCGTRDGKHVLILLEPDRQGKMKAILFENGTAAQNIVFQPAQ